MSEIEISQIQSFISIGEIVLAEHIALRMRERKIKRNDLFEFLINGEIIEQYPDDTPYPSCLILGSCGAGKPLHIVVGVRKDILCCMITAYHPDLDKWEEDFKTKKRGS